MADNKRVIVGDLGGTFLRIAHLSEVGLGETVEVEASEFINIYNALDFFKARHANGSLEGYKFALSFGRKVDPEGEIAFDYKDNGWRFYLNEVKDYFKLDAFNYVHDAEAMGLAVFSDRQNVFSVVKPGQQSGGRRTIIFAGTGIGHCFVSTKTNEVIDTHGGHFVPAIANAEQWDLISRIKGMREKQDGGRSKKSGTFIFEHLLAGEGLHSIYSALCNRGFFEATHRDVREMLEHPRDPMVKQAAAHYSEFLGLYAHVLCSVGHAYGGIYLAGGFIGRLDEAGLLDTAAFQRGLIQDMVETVDRDLRNVPIHKVRAKHTGLYGLEVYSRHRGWI